MSSKHKKSDLKSRNKSEDAVRENDCEHLSTKIDSINVSKNLADATLDNDGKLLSDKKSNDDSVEAENKENGVDFKGIEKVSTRSHNFHCIKEINEFSFSSDSKPFVLHLEVDLAAAIMFVVAVIIRMWRLEEPRSIVFDELHYGKYASLYMKQTFFFDCNPPLGKQLIALAGYLAGFDGNVKFDRIGGEYPVTMPVCALRSVPAFFGSILVPTIYYLIVELNLTHRTALFAGCLIILENSLLTQSRFILMESILLWFSVFGILSYLKFRKESSSPYNARWWLWLFSSSISLTCAVCTKYMGVFSAAVVICLLIWDYWKMISDVSLNVWQLLLHLIVRIAVVCILPACLYLFVFYIHLGILIKAGPHDNIMTSAFQASLEGGLATITKGQPLEIAHGSQITLRHTHGRACWLHSHPHVYPIRYPDKRGSSHQQQVTCYSFKDVNNWWIVKKPEINDLVVSEPIDKIKHGDVIQLIHGMSSRALNSHDVAAPMSPQHQEVSCYIDYNISFPAQNLWRVDILNRDTEGEIWHTIRSHVRFIHATSEQALKFSGKQLPEWGFHQHEIVTDRLINQDDTIWNVEEHRYTKNSDQKEREREMGMAEFVPLEPTKLSFLEKFWELQYKMLTANNENVQDHLYSSEPLDWLFLTRGIAYWISPHSNAQIHLLGNIVIWYSATVAIVVYLAFLIFYLLRRRRGFYDIPEYVWGNFCCAGQIGLAGYMLHYVPYFFVDRTLFLHHYLPAYLYKIILLVAVIEHIDFILNYIGINFLRKIFYSVFLFWLMFVVYAFIKLSIFSYGTVPLSAEDIINLRWKDTWDFIIHSP